jgi:methylase of polypeptide subunit release factors
MDELGLWIGVIALKLEAELRAIGEAAAELDSQLIVLDGPPLHRRLHGDVPLRRASLSVLAAPDALDRIRGFAVDRGWGEHDRPKDDDGDRGTSASRTDPASTQVRLRMGRATLELAAEVTVPGLARSDRERLTRALSMTDSGAGEGLMLPAAEPLLVYLAAKGASRNFTLEGLSADIQACAHQVVDWAKVDRIATDLHLPPEALHGTKNGGGVNLDSLREALGTPSATDARPPTHASFRGMTLLIQPGVFPPDAISERLVDLGMNAIRDRSNPVVVDVGTGAGPVALALAAERPDAEVWATDESAAAISVCRQNRDRHGLRNVHCRAGHLLEPLPESLTGRVSLVLSNVPYVPPLFPGDERERYPAGTVVGPGQDGLGLLLELAGSARKLLEPAGTLAVQALDLQVERLSSRLDRLGYEPESPADPQEPTASPIVLAAKWRAER